MLATFFQAIKIYSFFLLNNIMEDYTAEKKEKKKEKKYKKDHWNITRVFQEKKNIEKEIVRNSEIKMFQTQIEKQ